VVDGNPLTDIALLDGQGENIPVIVQAGRLYRNRLSAKESIGIGRAAMSA